MINSIKSNGITLLRIILFVSVFVLCNVIYSGIEYNLTKISLGSGWQGTYLKKANEELPANLRAAGWQISFRGGNGWGFRRGLEHLTGTCARGHFGFDICQFDYVVYPKR